MNENKHMCNSKVKTFSVHTFIFSVKCKKIIPYIKEFGKKLLANRNARIGEKVITVVKRNNIISVQFVHFQAQILSS